MAMMRAGRALGSVLIICDKRSKVAPYSDEAVNEAATATAADNAEEVAEEEDARKALYRICVCSAKMVFAVADPSGVPS